MGTNSLEDDAVALRARWVIPVDRPPIDGGIVTVAGGRIVAVGENASGRPVRDLADVALLPGLVNAHTHLEFSLLRQPLGHSGVSLPEWIRLVIDYQRQSSGVDQQPAVSAGLAQSLRAGVALLGEIATAERSVDADQEAPNVVAFRELLGLAPSQVAPRLQLAAEHLARAATQPHIHPGLSPHAPYTVHPALLRRACELSSQHRIPLAMHVAESREELALLREHTGPLVDLLSSLGAWYPEELPQGLRPLDYLRHLAMAHQALVVHGNYLADDEIAFLAAHRERLSLVYCPRTHAYFGHETYPLARMLAAGVRMAVGTDSRASNPDLDLLAELRHIARHHPDVSPDAILRMGTLSGAEALGQADHFGSITPGKLARLVVLDLGSEANAPLERLLAVDAPDPAWVEAAG